MYYFNLVYRVRQSYSKVTFGLGGGQAPNSISDGAQTLPAPISLSVIHIAKTTVITVLFARV